VLLKASRACYKKLTFAITSLVATVYISLPVNTIREINAIERAPYIYSPDAVWRKDVMTRQNTYRSYLSLRRFFLLPSLLFLTMLGLMTTTANAAQPNLAPNGNYTSIAAAPNGGLWVQLHTPAHMPEYRTLAIDGAPQYDTVNEPGSITAIPGTNKYWVVTLGGRIFDRGGAPYLCEGHLSNCSGFRNGFPRHDGWIVAAAASPRGDGLWAVDNEGAVWTAGNVVSYGDVKHDNGHTPTGIVATPSGRGYYIVLDDGGVHGRGDAVLFGSTGGNPPGGHDITGMALSYDIFGRVNGYWLVGSDGGVHSFGGAPFLGSTGGGPGRHAVSNIVTQADGRSYAWVYADGRVEKSREAPPFVIESITENKVIEVPNGSTDPITPLKLAGADGDSNQKWKLLKHGDAFKFVNVATGLCMDLEYGAESGRVIQYPCKQEEMPTNQLWTLKGGFDGMQLYTLEQPDYRLYGYPDEYGAGLIVSYFTNDGLSWKLTQALD